MFDLRNAGVVGASLAVAGGVAYCVWNYASSSGEKKPRAQPKEPAESAEGERREGVATEPTVAVPVAAEPGEASEQSEAGGSAGTQVLVLGLDGAGKTSLLHCFSTGCLEQDVEPTQGFNAVSISREDLRIEFLEIGGKEELRSYWGRYMSKALLLVFVVDSSDPKLFPVAKQHLHELLASSPRLPLMVLANKQDLPGSCGITDLHDALSLSEAGDRRLFLIGTHVGRGRAELSSGVQDARDLIMQMVCDGR
ncbi:ADP-ribosylation factor-like protein 9 isoform X1 [Pungitius pungitius]|uniref:ADP-ribosylation factor-like protein 9 isoform X1 n=1 Tax=Pungitius pungitius TaxID=134920 RepID=UPI001887441C|nr:ADP-ribosylation factor-like protein 9 isoform X1 [Pungitius pungitius]